VPDSVCAALERAMAKDPADRPVSAEALGMSLQAALAREGIASAAPPLLLAPGVVAPFVVSDSAPALGTVASGPASAGYDGERTITGWVAPVEPLPAEPTRRRRRTPLWVLGGAAAAIAAALLVWRGAESPAPASAAGPGAGTSTSPSAPASSAARPSTSSSPSPSASSTSGSPTARSTAGSGSGGTVTSGSSGSNGTRTSTSPKPRQTAAQPTAKPSPKPSSTGSPTPAPPPPAVPSAPRAVRAGGAVVVPGASPSVSVRLSWKAATSGAAATAYEVRWTVASGPQKGTRTLAATVTGTSTTVVVPQPASGVRYQWQVRALAGSTGSSWVTARVTVPGLVGRRAAQARACLRALGLSSSTYSMPASTKASVGRVLAQSLPRGRVVGVGSSIALGIGKAA
jgi:hypothetical protein